MTGSKFFIITQLICFIILGGCSSNQIFNNGKNYKVPGEYNFKFIGFDQNINDPVNDERSYYKVYIDKVEAGRTTIGLESQKKSFKSKLSINRHLITVEKWKLDKKKGKYIKLNNIAQPKPNYLYMDVPRNKIVIITLINNTQTKNSTFKIDFELEKK